MGIKPTTWQPIIILLAALTLTGCAEIEKVQKFTVADVTRADKLAIASKDAAGQACWEAVLPTLSTDVSTGDAGVATAIETARAGISQQILFKCQGILPITIPGL